MRVYTFIISILLMLSILGCSSTFKVTSDPVDAEVSVLMGEKKEKKTIGKTPLEIPMSELNQALGDEVQLGQFFTLYVSKPGYETQSFHLPSTRFATSLTQIDVKFVKEAVAEKENKDKEMRSAQDILNQLFLAQKFAVSKQYERALIEVDRILLQFPAFARALSMKGSIYLAQQKYDESIKWYEEALKADPQMEETVRLAAKARELMTGRKPAQK